MKIIGQHLVQTSGVLVGVGIILAVVSPNDVPNWFRYSVGALLLLAILLFTSGSLIYIWS